MLDSPPVRVLFGLLMLACVIPAQQAHAQSDEKGLPLPRYASFKSSEVNLRAGPGENYPKQWVYQRAGMPVEIFEEWDTWRRVRDYQGVTGWVSVNLLTSKRTAVVLETRRTLRDSASEAAECAWPTSHRKRTGPWPLTSHSTPPHSGQGKRDGSP